MPFSSKKALAGEPGRAVSTRWHVAEAHVIAYGTASAEVKGCAHACRQTWADDLRLDTLLSKASGSHRCSEPQELRACTAELRSRLSWALMAGPWQRRARGSCRCPAWPLSKGQHTGVVTEGEARRLSGLPHPAGRVDEFEGRARQSSSYLSQAEGSCRAQQT